MRNTLFSTRQSIALAIAVGAIVGAQVIYALGWDNYFVSDDWFFLYAVAQVNRFSELLTLVSFQTDWFVRPTQWFVTFGLYRWFGIEPRAFHVFAQLLDFSNALLVGLVLYQIFLLSKQMSRARSMVLSALGIGLFLSSWRHHEALYWYSASNELLTTFFKLLGLNAMLWWLGHKRQYWLVLIACVIAMALAILSKESALLLPLETLLALFFVLLAQRDNALPWKRGLLIVGAQFFVIGIWAFFYLQSSRLDAEGIARGGLQLLHATPVDWLLRAAQFFNAHFPGSDYVARNAGLLGAELILLAAITLLAILRKQWLWLVAIIWLALSVAPYVALTADNAVRAVLARGIGGDRYVYYSAAAFSLLLIAASQWIHHELGGREKIASRFAGVALLGLVVWFSANALTIFNMERDWANAGEISKRVLNQVKAEMPAPASEDVLCFVDVPTQVNRKYVFQNGLAQALYLTYGRADFQVNLWRTSRDANPDTRACAAVFTFDTRQNRLARTK